MASDGIRTFVIFSYGDISWGAGSLAGIISNETQFFLPGSGTEAIQNVTTISNVGLPGLHIYRVDQNNIIEPNFISLSKYLSFMDIRTINTKLLSSD